MAEEPKITVPEEKKPSTTTHEEDRTTAGQRLVNYTWEGTQALIAFLVVGTGMIVAGVLSLRRDDEMQKAMATVALTFIIAVTNLVLGFYFGRTNHTKVGGVGTKETADGTAKER